MAVAVGDYNTADLYNYQPGMVLASVSSASAATSTGTTEALHSALTLSVGNIVSGRTYLILFGWRWVTSVAGDSAAGLIHASQSAITTASPVVAAAQAHVVATGGNENESTYTQLWTPGASGTWNVQAGVKRIAGTGNSQISAGQMNCFLAIVAG